MRFMNMSGAAAVAIIAGLAVTAGSASAQSFYVKAFGGLTVPQDDTFQLNERDSDVSRDTGFDFNSGYTLGIAGGYTLTPNIALEVEYAYRNANAEFKDTGLGEQSTESNAWMANAIYNFTPVGPTGQWQPYVGAGLGVADLSYEGIDSLNGGNFDSDYNFAYQLIGGVGYALNPNMTLVGEARFFGINDQDIDNSYYSFKTTYQTFDLLLGLNYKF